MRNKYLYFLLAFSCLATYLGCTKEGASNTASGNAGTGGSLARFTISGSFLYLVDDYSLKAFDISNPANPVLKNTVNLGFGIETIYPYMDKLFIGSTTGMFIYSISDPAKPVKLGEARHVRACDPVVAKDTVAYVTLRSSGNCGVGLSGLYTHNIKDITKPVAIDTMPLPMPTGLGYKDTTLFVACVDSGLAIISIKNPFKPKFKKFVKGNTFYDVIVLNDLLVCMVKSGVELYDIKDVNAISLISNIPN